MSICPIPGDVNCSHLVKVVPTRFLYCEVHIFTHIINKYLTGDTLRPCKHPNFTYTFANLIIQW